MSTQTQSLPPLSVRAAFQPSTLDRERRTVEITWTTGARVLRGFWERFWEELSLDPKHVRMERLNSGRAPFLMDHEPSLRKVAGVIERAWLGKGEGRAVVRFLKAGVDPDVDQYFERVADGIAPNVSVGYRNYKLEKVADGEGELPVMRATDWEPHEVSGVAIGADAGAHTRSEADTFNPCEVITRGEAPHLERNEMSDTTNALELERNRCAEITKLCRRSRLDDLGEEMIRNGTPLDQAREMVLNAIATRSESYGPSPSPNGAVEVVAPERDDRVRTLGAALASRAGCTSNIPEAARQYARLSMVDMARLCLEARGKPTRLMSGAELVRAAYHTTSDFPALLGEAGNRVLLDGYNAYAGGVKQISRKSSARDFRAKSLLRLGEFPELLKVAEHGEVKSGTIAEAKESYSLATFARIFALSRQAIINDDLNAFEMVRLYGRAAAELEATQLVGLLTSNPTMGDGQPLFSAAHGNLAATGGAISIPTLGEALRAMRTQKGLDKRTPINVIPRFLVVPAALEVVALQVTAEINATQASDVNPFTGKLVPIVDPRLDLHSATAWYVAADPALAPALEHSYLEGEEGPALTEQQGFEVMGTQWRVHMDFGCGVVSHEGLYKNPGA